MVRPTLHSTSQERGARHKNIPKNGRPRWTESIGTGGRNKNAAGQNLLGRKRQATHWREGRRMSSESAFWRNPQGGILLASGSSISMRRDIRFGIWTVHEHASPFASRVFCVGQPLLLLVPILFFLRKKVASSLSSCPVSDFRRRESPGDFHTGKGGGA